MDNPAINHYPKIQSRPSYLYAMVFDAFLIMLVSWGLYSVFGVFFSPLLVEFGWSRAMTAGAFSLSMILSGLLGVVMGGLADKYGPRVVVTFCGICLGAGYLLMSQVSAVWQLYLFYGVLIGAGVSGIWVPLLSFIARRFIRRRSLMTGIVSAGLGAGGLIAPPLLSWLISANDWRLSYIIQGSIILIVMVIGAQFLRREPDQESPSPIGQNAVKPERPKSEVGGFSLQAAMRTGQFWLIFIMFICLGFCGFTIMIHIVPHAIDLKMSPMGAATILSTLNGLTIVGNFFLGGFIGDKIGNRKIFIIGFILMTGTLVWQMFAGEEWALYVFSIFFGLAIGGMGTSESPLAARFFGLRSHGLIFGVLGLGYTIGSAIGPAIVGYIFDVTASYQLAFLVCAASSLIGLVLALSLKPIKKLGEAP
jgi:MFS family permease